MVIEKRSKAEFDEDYSDISLQIEDEGIGIIIILKNAAFDNLTITIVL